MHDVAVGNDVILALEPQFAGVARARLAAARHVVVVGNGFSADETALEIAVNDAGCRRRLGAARDGPGARLLRPGGEEGDEIEKAVAGADEPVEAGLVQA